VVEKLEKTRKRGMGERDEGKGEMIKNEGKEVYKRKRREKRRQKG
jgi:hypothetical protein